MKKIWVITLFPQYFEPFKEYGVVGKLLSGERGGDVELKTILLSDFSEKGFKGVDDTPFGGGAGMVMRADVLEKSLKSILSQYTDRSKLHVICPYPRGEVFNQKKANELASILSTAEKDLVFICGRYEGIDERFLNQYVDEFISLGDFILSGGELATQMILDATLRLLQGTLGNNESLSMESFDGQGLEYALYTRPREFNGEPVPKAYISGDHKKIEAEKKRSSAEITKKYRPDLL